MNKTIITDSLLTDISENLLFYPEKQIFILVDDNTAKYCLPTLLQHPTLSQAQIIIVPSGDENKTVYTAIEIWKQLSEKGCTRHSLLINVGGGMITDLGGFAASTFKRGIDYINISTTLLGAVDAATGGKTGVNFQGLKNEIGVFKPAKQVYIAVDFFKTLDDKNLRSGFAEMIKHALISSETDVKNILRFDLEKMDWNILKSLLQRNIEIKQSIVEKDPMETDIRKALNLGHTIGHALESYSYTTQQHILHGYAVLWGCVAELYLSYIKLGFPKETVLQIVTIMKEYYGRYTFSCKQYETLFQLMQHDKKNESEQINFTLLANVGDIRINQTANKEEIFEALDFLREN